MHDLYLSNLLSPSLLWAFVPEMPAGSIHIPQASCPFVLLGLKTRSETHNFVLCLADKKKVHSCSQPPGNSLVWLYDFDIEHHRKHL
eukprot:s4958_g5.t1